MIGDWSGPCIWERRLEQYILESKTDLRSVGGPIFHLIDANEDKNIVAQYCFPVVSYGGSLPSVIFTTVHESMRNFIGQTIVANMKERETLPVLECLEWAVFRATPQNEKL